jgi:capsular polysaccharide export protein
MKILIYLDSIERFNFFKRFIPIKEELVFITNILSVYLLSKKEKYNIYLIKKVDFNKQVSYIDTLDFKAGWLNKKEIRVNYTSAYKLVLDLYKIYNFKVFFLWNGERTINLALSDFARDYKVKTLFFEISNLPSKLFIDYKGVNAKSSLAIDKSILNDYLYKDIIYQQWKLEFLNNKFKNHIVQQSKGVKAINIYYILDLIGFYILELPKNENKSILNKIKLKFLANSYKFKYDSFDIKTRRFIFLPLQVSTDSQILINSDIDNIQAIDIAYKMALQHKVALLIKPHPAEQNIEYIKRLEKLKEKYDFYFVNYNTFKLIKYSEEVITINSTIGIEAMIMNKKVNILGRAYYKDFNQEDLKRYIMSYLIDVDYFNNKEISIDIISEIFKRVKNDTI